MLTMPSTSRRMRLTCRAAISVNAGCEYTEEDVADTAMLSGGRWEDAGNVEDAFRMSPTLQCCRDNIARTWTMWEMT